MKKCKRIIISCLGRGAFERYWFILKDLMAWTWSIQQNRDITWWKVGLSRSEYAIHSGMSDLSDIYLRNFSG